MGERRPDDVAGQVLFCPSEPKCFYLRMFRKTASKFFVETPFDLSPCKESAGFFAVQLTCLIGVVLDECFRFGKKSLPPKGKAASMMKVTIIFIVEVIINFSD
jgi:hypothetical protein